MPQSQCTKTAIKTALPNKPLQDMNSGIVCDIYRMQVEMHYQKFIVLKPKCLLCNCYVFDSQRARTHGCSHTLNYGGVRKNNSCLLRRTDGGLRSPYSLSIISRVQTTAKFLPNRDVIIIRGSCCCCPSLVSNDIDDFGDICPPRY